MITGSWVRDRGFVDAASAATPAAVVAHARARADPGPGWLARLALVPQLIVRKGRARHRHWPERSRRPADPRRPHATALGMSTLHMQIAKLENAVERYAFVQALTSAGTVTRRHHPRHEQVPVALVNIGGRRAGGGRTGRAAARHDDESRSAAAGADQVRPAGTTITAAGARAAITVLAAAPYSMLAHIASATSSTAHGVIVQLRNGPQLYFGPSRSCSRSGRRPSAVLQNHDSAGAAYIDVSDPQRPAAGARSVSPRRRPRSGSPRTTARRPAGNDLHQTPP